MVFDFLKNDSKCQTIPYNYSDGIAAQIGINPSLKSWQAIVTMVVLGVFAALLAKGFNLIRKFVYKGKDNQIDTDFDAGGKVSVGLTATTIVSQWTWVATLLQSSTVASKYGISGPFWYAAGATIQILLFAILSIELKVRAPGAKTLLQVVNARFGKRTHLVYCVFALLTNTIVTAMLMLGGVAVLTNLVNGLSIELATGLIAIIIGSYTFIGGLGATFYVSYFNSAIIFVIMLMFLVKVYGEPDNPDNPLGSIDTVYDLLNCSLAPEGNKDQNYLTMLSYPGLMFGIINIVGNFGTVFVDQSYWQSSVAAKPVQGVWGFLSGALTWFAVPFTFATTMGLAYIALSAQEGQALLSDDDVNAGLVPPLVAQQLMGEPGELLMVILILMAVTSTGSAEVIAVTSLIIYDVYACYIQPYRVVKDANSCVLCGKARGRLAVGEDKCACISMTLCEPCRLDDIARGSCKVAIKPDYACEMHGQFRIYNDILVHAKNWTLLWATIAIIPLTLILNAINVSLGWLYLFMGVVIGSAVIPIALCMTWSRLTGTAMIAGGISGAIIGLTTWLAVGSQQPGGLGNFFESTGSEITMLCGNLAAIGSGGLITVIVSFLTNKDYKKSDAFETWETTRDIDNPLSPWTELYERDLQLSGAHQLDNRPSLTDVMKKFKSARVVAYVGSILLTVILIIIWPSVMTSVGVMGYESFSHWVYVSHVWGYAACIFIIVFPLANEIWEMYRAKKEQKQQAALANEMKSNGKIDQNVNNDHVNPAFDEEKIQTGSNGKTSSPVQTKL